MPTTPRCLSSSANKYQVARNNPIYSANRLYHSQLTDLRPCYLRSSSQNKNAEKASSATNITVVGQSIPVSSDYTKSAHQNVMPYQAQRVSTAEENSVCALPGR